MSKDRFGEVPPSYSDFLEAVACVVIQTSVRRFLSRVRVHKLRLEKSWNNNHRLVSTHQTNVNRNMHPVSNRKLRQPQLYVFALAAIRIQSMFRGWHARDCIAVDHYCATIVQQTYRRHRAQSQFAGMVYCVIAIQAVYRGHRVRQDISVYRRQPVDAISANRSYQASHRLEADSFRYPSNVIQNLAATIIQSYARSWITRSVLRFWLRSSRTQTKYLFKPNSFLKKSQAMDAYNLPQGYHAHTAFMQQSVPSPVRSTVSQSHSSGRLDLVFASSDDEELEAYHKKIDEELEELMKRDQRKGLIKARTNEYFHNGPIADKGEASPARRTIITVVEKQQAKEIPFVTNTSFQEPGGVRSYHDIAKAISREETISPLDTRATPTHAPSEPPSFAHGASSPHEAKPAADVHLRPATSKPAEIDSSTAALPSSVVSSWNDRAAHGKSLTAESGRKSENSRPQISDASDVKVEKPAWMVTLEQKKSQSKSGGTALTVKSETAKNGELESPSDSNQTCDWKSRLRKTKSKDGSPVAVPHVEPHASTSSTPGSWHNKLRVTKLQDEHIVSNESGKENGQSRTVEVQGSTKPVKLSRAVNEIEVDDEKKDEYSPELESSNESDILEPPEKESPVPMKLKPILHKVVEPSAGAPVEAVTRRLEHKTIVVSSPGSHVGTSTDLAPTKLERRPVPAGDPLKSVSPVHVAMRNRRSEDEQRRVDAMHHIFLRNGLMGRREKEIISFAHTSSAQYQANHADQDVGPAARDLIHAWRGSDQTQPLMTGKLF